jgi:hypothetical protein
MIPESIKSWYAKLSFRGSIKDISYLPVEITAIIPTTLTKRAKIPKSSGVYILVRIGLMATGIAWAIVVPVIRVKTFLLNSDLGLYLFINYKFPTM